MSFQVQHVWLWIMVSFVASGLLSWFLYHRNPLNFTRKWMNLVLGLIRFSLLFILCIFLLEPIFHLVRSKTEKPIVFFALDNSESIAMSKDSTFYRTAFVTRFKQLQTALADAYEVQAVLFDKSISSGSTPDYHGKMTNMGNVFESAFQRYDNQNLGAVVLATDGISNQGTQPLSAAAALKVPVFAIALGDTLPQKDIRLADVRANEVVYAGNSFSIEGHVQASGFMGSTVSLALEEAGKVLQTLQIPIKAHNDFIPFVFNLPAMPEGQHHFTIQSKALAGERTISNNLRHAFINVVKSKQKVVLVYLSPHPDIAAMRSLLEDQQNIELHVTSITVPQTELMKDASVYILHQVPGVLGEGTTLVQELIKKNIPILFVLGQQVNLNLLQQLEGSLQVQQSRGAWNEARPTLNDAFNLFLIAADASKTFDKLPPLIAPFGEYQIRKNASVLFQQQLGYVKTQTPLWFFAEQAGVYHAFICGEGIWKWRLQETLLNGEPTETRALVNKTIQLLAGKGDKSRFRVTPAKRAFDESEPLQFEAEYYNESFEKDNRNDIQLTLKNEAGKKYLFGFSKENDAYQLNAGLFPPGKYTYEARIGSGSDMVRKGTVNVFELQLESQNTQANHQLLNTICDQSGGKLFYPNQLDALEKQIREHNAIKPRTSETSVVESIISMKWLFFVLLALLTTEWFVRKWNGSI